LNKDAYQKEKPGVFRSGGEKKGGKEWTNGKEEIQIHIWQEEKDIRITSKEENEE